MDLEKFPTSAAARRMLDSITGGFYDNSYVGKWIFQVMGIEWDEARKRIEELPYQAFLQTATWALRYFEEKYGLSVREDLNYDARRKLIEDKINSKGSMNPEAVRKIAENATGRECKVTEFIDAYTFCITILQGEKGFDFSDFLEKIDDNKPSHLSYKVILDISTEMMLAFACVTKEFKKTRALEYTGGDPLERIIWFIDESSNVLTDENDNILIEEEM